jgi:hypothetical protein
MGFVGGSTAFPAAMEIKNCFGRRYVLCVKPNRKREAIAPFLVALFKVALACLEHKWRIKMMTKGRNKKGRDIFFFVYNPKNNLR